ncbi:hypothetical protein ES705_27057 [subsurface metagenome]
MPVTSPLIHVPLGAAYLTESIRSLELLRDYYYSSHFQHLPAALNTAIFVLCLLEKGDLTYEPLS